MDLSDEYVSIKTATVLKELGFDYPCKKLYENDEIIESKFNINQNVGDAISIPTKSLANRWVRENYEQY